MARLVSFSGRWLMLLFACLGLCSFLCPQTSQAYELEGQAWLDATTEFHIDLPDPWESAFEDAEASWNQRTPFLFTLIKNSPKDPCESPLQQTPRNGAMFSSTVCGVAYGPTALAVTTNWTTDGGKTSLQSGIWYNTGFQWEVYSGPSEGSGHQGVYDFRRATMHELGHVLGLGHEETVPSIMHAVISDIEDPTADDIAGAEEIYLRPRISSINPNPVIGANIAQPLTINGSNFESGANVILRDLSFGQVFPNRTIASLTSSSIVINPNFTTQAADWSVEVVNVDGRSSGQFSFDVLDPSIIGSDLVVESLQVDPVQGASGGITTVAFTIRNQGNATSNSQTTKIRLAISDENVTTADPLLRSLPNLSGIPPSGGLQVTVQVLIPEQTAGPHHVWIILDVDSSAGQLNETNDQAHTPFTVLGGEPDLVVESLEVVPTSGVPGSNGVVNFTIRNLGSSAALASTTNVRLSASNANVTINDPLLATVNTPGIPIDGGLSVSQPVTIPAVNTGSYYIWVTLDVDSTAGQSNEGNDQAATPFEVTEVPIGEPDLVVENLEVVPTSGAPGSNGVVNFTIRNLGSSVALASTANVRLSASNANVTINDPLLATVNTPGIPIDGGLSVSQPVTIPAVNAGSYYIWVTLDADSTAGQSNEANDQGVRPFEVTEAPNNGKITFAWPLAVGTTLPVVVQDYSCRGTPGVFSGSLDDSCYDATSYHSGLDFRAQAPVRVNAVADGIIRKICKYDGLLDTQFSKCYTGESIDVLGTVIVVEHGSNLYSLYAHLSNVDDISEGQAVKKGEQIALSGNSGSVPYHLHFEIKDNDNLLITNVYPPYHPSGYGYKDPWEYNENTRISPVPIQSVRPSMLVRRGPGSEYTAFSGIGRDEKLIANAKHVGEGDIWYRVYLPCGNSNSCAGWLAGVSGGFADAVEIPDETQLEIAGVGVDGLPVWASVDTSSDTNIIDRVFEQQRFVVMAGKSSADVNCSGIWYRIELPAQISGTSTGWICGHYVSVIPPNGASDADEDGVDDSIDAFPNDPTETIDTDGDEMPDEWELDNGFDPEDPSDAGLDYDGDGLANLQEYELGTVATNPDSDDDGVPDGNEISSGTNPHDNESAVAPELDPPGDADVSAERPIIQSLPT
ncbi:MAG: hypothetical protein DRQ56_06135 [Gammaproteobacteria bacterium]|nr:MAG: hypothetical protein DRQ56_06135 [Gammaproteobacteria bacterium]